MANANFNKGRTLIMGILNVTPDSFSDGGLYFNKDEAVKRATQIINEGADIIDIGGESTRPGSKPVSAIEELNRVLPVVKALRKKFSAIEISVDTYKAEVAEACLKAGTDMINSLGGFLFDEKLAEVVAKYNCKIVLYHIKGQPKTMQKGKIVYDDVILEIKEFFKKQIQKGLKKGIKKDTMILDPGIGFGKEVDHNVEIIRRFDEFCDLKLPLMVGVSRKSHLGIILKEELKLRDLPSLTERMEAGLAEVAVAVLKGANIVRTHDVLATKKFLTILDKIYLVK